MSLPQIIITTNDHTEAVLVPAGDFVFGIDQNRVTAAMLSEHEYGEPEICPFP